MLYLNLDLKKFSSHSQKLVAEGKIKAKDISKFYMAVQKHYGVNVCCLKSCFVLMLMLVLRS